MIVANIKRVFSLDQGPFFMFLPCQYLFIMTEPIVSSECNFLAEQTIIMHEFDC